LKKKERLLKQALIKTLDFFLILLCAGTANALGTSTSDTLRACTTNALSTGTANALRAGTANAQHTCLSTAYATAGVRTRCNGQSSYDSN